MDNNNQSAPQPAVDPNQPVMQPQPSSTDQSTQLAQPVIGMGGVGTGATPTVSNSQNPVIQGPMPMPVQPTGKSEGGNKLVVWLIGGLVIVLLIVAGIYLYMSNQQTKTGSMPAETVQPVAEKTDEVKESDVDSVELDDIDKEFEVVEKDLETL